MEDKRRSIARYYDFWAKQTDDIEFYVSQIIPEDRTVLELGCGTGRVLIPLSRQCDFIVRVDKSRSMLAFCQEKLQKNQISPNNAALVCEDIASLNLQRKFGLIIAPFRVFQNIETDDDVDGFFHGIHRHLSPHGCCILNVFKPNAPLRDLLEIWRDPEEIFSWEKSLGSGVLKHNYQMKRIKEEPLIIYPELIYKYYEGEELVDEVSSIVPIRVYYADEFREVIMVHGFSIIETWGGYRGEKYGEGPELVIKFMKETSC